MPSTWLGSTRQKYIHSVGSVGKVEFVPAGKEICRKIYLVFFVFFAPFLIKNFVDDFSLNSFILTKDKKAI